MSPIIQPWQFERKCNSTFDAKLLTISNIDRSEKIYIRNFYLFEELEIAPASNIDQPEWHWEFALLKEFCQAWKPSGYGLGDLIYTLSLLPGEELTLEVKTWQTDRRIEKESATIEERSLSDIKSNNSDSSEASNSVNTKEHIGVDARAGYSGFGGSVSVNTNWSEDVATSDSLMVKKNYQRMDQMTSELKATRQVKIEISRETGSESKTTRKIKNINQTRTLNALFFQVISEYQIQTTFNAVSLILLGAVAHNPAQKWTYDVDNKRYLFEENLFYWNKNNNGALITDENNRLSWLELIRRSSDIYWARDFELLYGLTPFEVIRRAWIAYMYTNCPKAAQDKNVVGDYQKAFVDKMLTFVRPTENWIEPGPNTEMRWAYEVIPGKEQDLLTFLENESGKGLSHQENC